MSTARQRAGFRGVNKLRRTLRRLEPEVVKKVKAPFERGAEIIQFDAIQNAMMAGLVDSGDMIASIEVKMGRDGLSAVIGPGADKVRINKNPFNTTLYKSAQSKHEAWQFFKGYWAEFGTKGYPEDNIPAQRATPFMTPAFDANKHWISRQTQAGIKYALLEVTQGDGSNE